MSSAFLKNNRKKTTKKKNPPPPRKNSQDFVQHKPAMFVFCNHGLKSALDALISYEVASEDQLPLPSHADEQTPLPQGYGPRVWSCSCHCQGEMALTCQDHHSPPGQTRLLSRGEMLGTRARKSHQERDANPQISGQHHSAEGHCLAAALDPFFTFITLGWSGSSQKWMWTAVLALCIN